MELSNCSLVIVRILNDILLWIYMCCMDGSAYEIKFDFLFCFLLVFCLLLNDRHVKLLRNPSFRFMWSKSNKFLLNLYHKINPIAIFFSLWNEDDVHKSFKLSSSLLFFICVSKFIITMTSSYSRTHFHKVHDMHFPRLIWKREFSRITNACTINLLYDVRFFLLDIVLKLSRVFRGCCHFVESVHPSE